MYPKLTSSLPHVQKKLLPSSAGSRSVTEALFSADEHIKEPGSVREVGAHMWAWCADAAKDLEVDEDKVLNRREWCHWCWLQQRLDGI